MSNPASKYKVDPDTLVTFLVEDRSSKISDWGLGNSKIGPGIYTYSKLPGRVAGSCPGSSGECELICYAKRLIKNKPVWSMWEKNTERGDELPPLPADATIVRIHVSGDFDTVGYIQSWIDLATNRPDVVFFGYTRSWRVPELLPKLEEFGALQNVHLWASMDKTIKELPPKHWRKAWIEGDERLTKEEGRKTLTTIEGVKAIVCPEEAGLVKDCETCGYCFEKTKGDLVFLEH